MTDMPHPRYDFLMAYTEILDEHNLLCVPHDPSEGRSYDELSTEFALTLPWPPEDPAETTASEERELAAAYAGWLADQGELVVHPILTPGAVAERLLYRINRKDTSDA